MRLLQNEPDAGPWQALRIDELAAWLLSRRPPGAVRPTVMAIDGRGGSGKSTLADALLAAVPGAVVVHTDDIAWHEPFFEWQLLLDELILAPLSRGHSVDVTPPAWPPHGRTGRIQVPTEAPLVVVEGTGAADARLRQHYDAVLWVQSDFDESERRGLARDEEHGENGDAAQTEAFWHEWMGHELRHFETDRPWQVADLVVCGTPSTNPGPGSVMVPVAWRPKP